MAARTHSQALNRLFARKQVADLSMLKKTLDTTSRTTVFRALSAAGYYTSYSDAVRTTHSSAFQTSTRTGSGSTVGALLQTTNSARYGGSHGRWRACRADAHGTRGASLTI